MNIQRDFIAKMDFCLSTTSYNNDLAIGRADGYISTLFKPKDGIEYWKGEREKYEHK